MVDDKQKPLYAAFLAQQPDPFLAAQMLVPTNIGVAAWVAGNWSTDPEVLAERDRVKKEIGESLLPDKTQLAELVWGIATQKYAMTEDRIKAAKLYAEIRGFISKAAPVEINANVNTKVIYQKDHGSDDEWESEAEKQQRELLSVATSRH